MEEPLCNCKLQSCQELLEVPGLLAHICPPPESQDIDLQGEASRATSFLHLPHADIFPRLFAIALEDAMAKPATVNRGAEVLMLLLDTGTFTVLVHGLRQLVHRGMDRTRDAHENQVD